jgi:hypothetical protein
MSNVRQHAEALRDECEKMARAAEQDMCNPSLSADQRDQARDNAKAYWQMSRNHADTVVHAVDARLQNFTAKNSGLQIKTKSRLEFLRRVSKEIGDKKRQVVAIAAWNKPEAKKLFKTYDALYRFLGRSDCF